MRISYYLAFLTGTLLPVQTIALEPVTEPHAMFYYQISLGGDAKKPRHIFGFRMDKASYQPGQMIDYHALTQNPAAMDFRFNHQGAEAIRMSGVDYLKMYRVHKADGEATVVEERMDEGGEVMDESIGEAAEEKKTGNVATKVISDIGATVGAALEAAPTGFLIGGAILVVLLAGG